VDALLTHPHITELRNRRKALLERLSGVVGELQELKDKVLPGLLTEYDHHFRALEIALQQQTLQTSEIMRREELFRIKLGRGEKLSEAMITTVNTIVDREFERVKKRFRESFGMSKEEREESATKRSERHNESEFANLYRSIVKKLHPDAAELSPQQTGAAFEQFWHSTQEAYKQRNMRELQAIHDVVCMTDESEKFTTLNSTKEYLEAEIMRLESRLRNEERRLREITQNPPYTVRELMKSRTWIESESNAIKAKIAEKERDFKRAKEFLVSLNADKPSSWNSVEAPSDAAKQEEFANDFMENTYFNNR
jgi:hypothetical protein